MQAKSYSTGLAPWQLWLHCINPGFTAYVDPLPNVKSRYNVSRRHYLLHTPTQSNSPTRINYAPMIAKITLLSFKRVFLNSYFAKDSILFAWQVTYIYTVVFFTRKGGKAILILCWSYATSVECSQKWVRLIMQHKQIKHQSQHIQVLLFVRLITFRSWHFYFSKSYY